MSLSREQIKSAALELDPVEREALAEELLLSIDAGERERLDAAWLEEVKRRDDAFRDGKGSSASVEEVIARLKRKAGR